MDLALAPLLILAVGSLWAQDTVRLTGKITDLATGLPVENAIVKLNGETAYSDTAGYYSFDDVVVGAGRIDIVAQGFVALRATNPDDVSIQISLEHPEHNFKLIRSAAISGRVIDKEPDKPGEGLIANLLREDFTEGVRHFVSGGVSEAAAMREMTIVGNDGSFTFVGLEPGRYIVSVSPRAIADLIVRANGISRPASPKETYALTFFPGTTKFSDAIPLTVASGETGVANFRVTKQPLFRVSGEVDVPGDGGEGRILLESTGDGFGRNPLIRRQYTGKASLPGQFIVEGLPPGQYVVLAVAAVPNVPSVLPFEVNFPLMVTDHDEDGLRLVAHPPAAELGVNGSFRMDNDGAKLPAGLAVQFSYPEPGGQSDAVPAAPNGAFWLTGLPGEYSVRPLVPAGYAVKEIRYGGGKYLNSLIPVRGETPDSSLTIMLSDQPGSVTGSVVDSQGKPAAARIVLAPDPLPAGFDFRAFRVAKNDDKGTFVFSGLAPGRYKAVALTGDDRKRDHDLAILGDQFRAADAFEVTAGQSVNVGLHP